MFTVVMILERERRRVNHRDPHTIKQYKTPGRLYRPHSAREVGHPANGRAVQARTLHHVTSGATTTRPTGFNAVVAHHSIKKKKKNLEVIQPIGNNIG